MGHLPPTVNAGVQSLVAYAHDVGEVLQDHLCAVVLHKHIVGARPRLLMRIRPSAIPRLIGSVIVYSVYG